MNRNDAFALFHRVVELRHRPEEISTLFGVDHEPIVGFLDTGFPEEVALAAGYRPMLLTGDPSRAPETVTPHLDVSAPARIRSLYEVLATGGYDGLDVLCVTGGDRWIGETAGFFEVYAEVFGSPRIARTLYLERARGQFSAHRDYNRDGIAVLVEEMGAVSGRAVTEAALEDAISVLNRTRALLRRLEALRTAAVPTVSGADAAAVTLAALLSPRQAFNEALDAALDAVTASPAVGLRGPRVFVSGSSLDHSGHIELIEGLGGVVVGEDTEFGLRSAHHPVDEASGDPIGALADRLTYKFPESWAFGRERRLTMRTELAAATSPDAVIALHLQGDSAYGWDYPDFAAALAEQGVPALPLSDLDYALGDADDLSARIAAFLGGLTDQHDKEQA